MRVMTTPGKPHDTLTIEDNRTQYNAVVRVLMERQNQDAKWGAQRRQHNLKWNAILTEEVGEAAKEVLEEDDDKLLAELTQVAAVALCWMEALIDQQEKRTNQETLYAILDGQTEGVSS